MKDSVRVHKREFVRECKCAKDEEPERRDRGARMKRDLLTPRARICRDQLLE